MTHFIVEWPLALPRRPIPDEADIVAFDEPHRWGGRPVYIRLPNGTHDLLPPALDTGENPPFTWGYHGSGPGYLEAAILRVCLGEDVESAAREGRSWLEERVCGRRFHHDPVDPGFLINVGEVRQHLQGSPPSRSTASLV